MLLYGLKILDNLKLFESRAEVARAKRYEAERTEFDWLSLIEFGNDWVWF